MSSIAFTSFFDPRVIIDREHQAVTMVCTSSQSMRRSASHSIAYHTQLWIERIESGQLRRFFIEFNGPGDREENRAFEGGQVKVYDRHIENPNWSRKSQTWSIEAERLNQMVETAQWEMQDSIAYPRAFNILGSRSILARSQKAFTTSHPFLQSFLKCNKALFEEIFLVAQMRPAQQERKSVELARKLARYGQRVEGVDRDVFLEKFRTCEGDYRVLCRTMMELMTLHVEARDFKPDNCLTWAREKLNSVGIVIRPRATDRIAAFPAFYMRRGEPRTWGQYIVHYLQEILSFLGALIAKCFSSCLLLSIP